MHRFSLTFFGIWSVLDPFIHPWYWDVDLKLGKSKNKSSLLQQRLKLAEHATATFTFELFQMWVWELEPNAPPFLLKRMLDFGGHQNKTLMACHFETHVLSVLFKGHIFPTVGRSGILAVRPQLKDFKKGDLVVAKCAEAHLWKSVFFGGTFGSMIGGVTLMCNSLGKLHHFLMMFVEADWCL